METYYERRLIDVCNNRLDRVLQFRFLPSIATGSEIDPNKIVRFEDSQNVFLVPSETDDTTTYKVDTALVVCDCRKGMTGGPCKHQYLVVKKFNIYCCWNFISANDIPMRKLLYKVATGCANAPEEWFLSLNHQSGPERAEINLIMESISNATYENDGADDNSMDSMNDGENRNEGAVCTDVGISDNGHDAVTNPWLASLHLQRSLQNQFDTRGCTSK
nr:uncharacterized protein LOC129266746 [Lytechinus pictus]